MAKSPVENVANNLSSLDACREVMVKLGITDAICHLATGQIYILVEMAVTEVAGSKETKNPGKDDEEGEEG